VFQARNQLEFQLMPGEDFDLITGLMADLYLIEIRMGPAFVRINDVMPHRERLLSLIPR
jgi:hypothetical protein